MDYLQSMVDFVLHIDVHMTEMVALYGMWIYAILFVIIFCETGLVVTPFLPGDSLLFMAGALASLPTNPMNIHLLVFMLIAAAVLGDAANYMIGRFFGEKLFRNPNSKIFKQSYLDKTHRFYEKHGGKDNHFGPFCPDRTNLCPICSWYGTYGVPSLPFVQYYRQCGVGCTLLLCRLPVWRARCCTAQPEIIGRTDYCTLVGSGLC